MTVIGYPNLTEKDFVRIFNRKLPLGEEFGREAGELVVDELKYSEEPQPCYDCDKPTHVAMCFNAESLFEESRGFFRLFGRHHLPS